VLVASACSAAPVEPDRAAYLAHMPRSILVLPPVAETLDADAPYSWLPTITRPLAERGYYVFPVAVVDAMMKEDGLRTPSEMRRVPPQHLLEEFGADAVLYVDLPDWGTSLHDLQLETKVTVAARLVDLRSGTELWRGASTVVQDAGGGEPGVPSVSFFDALVNGIPRAPADPSIGLARQASWSLVHSPDGLLLGPRHPGFAEDQRERLERPSSSAR
jgi:hypothetical protein